MLHSVMWRTLFLYASSLRVRTLLSTIKGTTTVKALQYFLTIPASAVLALCKNQLVRLCWLLEVSRHDVRGVVRLPCIPKYPRHR